jgi:hypothetical protein
LPGSEDFRKKFGKKNFEVVESNARAMYNLVKTPKPWKAELISHINNIEGILDEIELEFIRQYGSVVEISAKEEIIKTLRDRGFVGVIGYIKKAETEFSNKNSKECCYQARLAIEEFFRFIREKISQKNVPRGSLGDHLDYLEKVTQTITHSERLLVQNGFYAFLSEKGNHATKDVPSPEDAKLSLYILYILTEYYLEKLGKKI